MAHNPPDLTPEDLEVQRQARERQDRYLAEPDRCPYCGSDDLTGGSLTVDTGSCTQRVWCSDCDRSWYDIYTLAKFEEV